MSITFDEGYFHGERQDGYTLYGRDMWAGAWTFGGFADDLLDEAGSRGVSLTNRRVLVVGCGYGFTVEELANRGVQAFGVELSAYAVSQSPVPARIVQGDATQRSTMNAARSLAGLGGNARFDLLLTEDVLTCLPDAQVPGALTEWRRVAQRVAHRVTTFPQIAVHGYNIKTLAEWRAMIGAGDWLFDYFTWAEG